MSKKPNILFIGVDSLRRDRTSLYGYERLTTPHIDKFFSEDSIVFDNMFSPHIPTSPGYANMLTGLDCFGTNVVALRHADDDYAPGVKTLQEVLGENGYKTSCVGFRHFAARGFKWHRAYPANWGSWEQGRSPKAESLNSVAIPELEKLAAREEPFMLFLRHMDPHSPYLPPAQYERMFYSGNEFDENDHSLDECYAFEPFCNYFYTWFPPNCKSAEYICAQYDGAVAYMDSCISNIFSKLETLGIADNTIVILTSDHGETLDEHSCYFDHHGMYDCTLSVPLAIKFPKMFKGAQKRFKNYAYLKDIMPTLLAMLGIETDIKFDGRNLLDLIEGKAEEEPEMYITEATWMRKHGWRTPEWKLMVALEPDFHFKPEIELYNLIKDPGENNNVAEQEPEIVKMLTDRMNAFIAKREAEVGRRAPIYTNADTWSGYGRAFTSSEEAYRGLMIGDPETAKKLQEKK